MKHNLRLVVRAVLLVLPLMGAAAGCSTNPATGEQSFTVFMSPEQEQRVGAAEHPKLVQELGGAYDDPALAAYVTAVGRRVASVSEAGDVPFTFTIIDSDDVNAFALPGGYVYVTRGLLALANSEAELAGVLAHETGHVVAHHSAERYSRSIAVGLGSVILGALGTAAGLPAEAGDMIAAGSQAYLQSYSREQELEADMLGIRYLARAGYDPQAMAAFLKDLEAYARFQSAQAGRGAAGEEPDIMASHPRTADRVGQARRLAGANAVAEPRIGREDYLAHINGLIYGDSPEQGLRLGRDFYHPGLRIAFRVPPGFAMLNMPEQVVARGPHGALILFDMADPRTINSYDPVLYLRNWGGSIGLADIRQFEAGGMPGATGTARVRTPSGIADIRLAAIRAEPERLYRFMFLTSPAMTGPSAAEFRRTILSFRRLDEVEAARVQPLRIGVVTVQPGDGVSALAGRMAIAGEREQLFRVLNDLGPGEQPRAGQAVKIVAGGASPD